MANKNELRVAADVLQKALMADARLSLAAGMSAHEWRNRVNLLLHYSLPPEHVEHRQDARGHWFHRIKAPQEGGGG